MKKRKPLKKSKSGAETEFFLLDEQGRMVKEADKFMAFAKKRYPDLEIQPEAGQSMLEIGSYPSVKVVDTLIDLLENTKKLLDVAANHGYRLFPLATYPGKVVAEVTNKRWYKEQAMILGKEQYLNATLCCGFHYHYTLPRGVFDPKTKFLKEMVNSKIKQSMIDSYNLSIAMDPAVTTLLQSSPFTQGKFLAKDSRMLMYRGGAKLGYPMGKYGKYQSLGGLPPYKQTLNDLTLSLQKRQHKWRDLMLKHKLDPSWIIKKDNVLSFTWNPIRINRWGTLELRAPDMNYPKYVMALASFLKFIYRNIYRDFNKVIPSDVGIKEPFKVEGDCIYIPPHTHVRNVLQHASAHKGLASKDVHDYCQRFLRFGKRYVEKSYLSVVDPLFDIVKKKRTVSDQLIAQFKRKGYSTQDTIPNSVAAEICLKHSEALRKDVEETEEKLLKAQAD